jgi:hypothetical protein
MTENLLKIIESKDAQIKSLTEEIQVLKEQVEFFTQKLFGKSSEKSEPEGLISLFADSDFFSRQRQLKKKSRPKK